MENDGNHDRIQNWLLKLGSSPQQSVKTFVFGLTIFASGMAIIYLALVTVLWLQIIGIVCIIIGLVVSARGYVGILANRIAYFRHQSFKNREKYKHIK